MRHFTQAIIALFVSLFAVFVAPTTQAAESKFTDIRWEDLVPKGWDPAKELKSIDFSKLKDSDPRATEALDKMRSVWDSAPTDASLAGKKIRLPGFVIPLEHKGDKVTEFLIVPYFGACIHSPPPPANQIIQALAAKPIARMRSMDAFWISGTLSLALVDTPWGKAGYRMKVEKVEPYVETKGR